MRFNFYLIDQRIAGDLSYRPVIIGDVQHPHLSVDADNLDQAIKETFMIRPEIPFTDLVFESDDLQPNNISVVDIEPQIRPFTMELTIVPFSEVTGQSDFILMAYRMKLMTRIGGQRPAPHSVVINSLSGSMIEMMQLQEMMKVLKKHDYI